MHFGALQPLKGRDLRSYHGMCMSLRFFLPFAQLFLSGYPSKQSFRIVQRQITCCSSYLLLCNPPNPKSITTAMITVSSLIMLETEWTELGRSYSVVAASWWQWLEPSQRLPRSHAQQMTWLLARTLAGLLAGLCPCGLSMWPGLPHSRVLEFKEQASLETCGSCQCLKVWTQTRKWHHSYLVQQS